MPLLPNRRAGARVHARERVRIRRARAPGRARCRRVRTAALVLLQRAPRLLRGDRQVPRRPPDLGAVDARALRSPGRAFAAVAVPHADGRGVSLTAQQPEVNIVRTTIEALAGVLGGTQSLHTNSMDETLALPTEKAARIALRTQQVIANETRVTNVADPLGGSWFVEALTDEMERARRGPVRAHRRARRRIDARRRGARRRGGLVPGRDRGGRVRARAEGEPGRSQRRRRHRLPRRERRAAAAHVADRSRGRRGAAPPPRQGAARA